jgi:hypothetical protein
MLRIVMIGYAKFNFIASFPDGGKELAFLL